MDEDTTEKLLLPEKREEALQDTTQYNQSVATVMTMVAAAVGAVLGAAINRSRNVWKGAAIGGALVGGSMAVLNAIGLSGTSRRRKESETILIHGMNEKQANARDVQLLSEVRNAEGPVKVAYSERTGHIAGVQKNPSHQDRLKTEAASDTAVSR